MSEELPNYVQENYAKASKMSLEEWLSINPLPALCEPKLDGIRVFLFKSGDKLVISSKHGAIYTPNSSPKVFAAVPEFTRAPHRMILDGEYVKDEGLHFFDVIQVDDRDLRSLPLTERKKILKEILADTGLELRYKLAKTKEQVLTMKDQEIKKGGEGLMLKDPGSTYGQHNSWLKLKRFDTIDCFIIDYADTPEMERTGVPHSWHLGVYDGTREVNLGKVGAYIEKVDPRKVKIGSVVEVRYNEVTDDLKLREPFIIRVRHDKTPNECLLSQVK
ncbi:MAG: hypothetical protein OK456_01240 [Thaumarchaeota archaeon]|nr:hypothetical protein [Nitrososphaerota archaeon]